VTTGVKEAGEAEAKAINADPRTVIEENIFG
jgi:hypothetical protein